MMEQKGGGHSRLAFLDVGLFVTASEGEELVVDIRHGEEDVGGFCSGMRVFCSVGIARKVAQQTMAGEKASGQGS